MITSVLVGYPAVIVEHHKPGAEAQVGFGQRARVVSDDLHRRLDLIQMVLAIPKSFPETT
jgi:hypothetical protein